MLEPISAWIPSRLCSKICNLICLWLIDFNIQFVSARSLHCATSSNRGVFVVRVRLRAGLDGAIVPASLSFLVFNQLYDTVLACTYQRENHI